MLNEERVKLKSQKIVYEHGEGGVPLKLRSFFKNPAFDRSKAFNILCAIISYVLILGLSYYGGGYKLINFESNLVASILILIGVLATGVLFVAVYTRVVSRALRHRYEDVRSNLARYELIEEKLK